MPGSRDGLTRLSADLPAAPLSEIQDNLQEEELFVSLPTFYVETTTKPVAALAKVKAWLFQNISNCCFKLGNFYLFVCDVVAYSLYAIRINRFIC